MRRQPRAYRKRPGASAARWASEPALPYQRLWAALPTMADDRGEPGALTPLRDPDMPADIDAAANIDASSVNAEASVDSPGSTLRASADRLAEPSRATCHQTRSRSSRPSPRRP